MLPRPLRNFEMQMHYQNEPKFDGIYSRNKLPGIKDGAYVKNLDEYKSIGTHWIALYVNANNIIYFDSFRVERIPKFITNKNTLTNIYRMQLYDSIMRGYFCIGFIDFKVKVCLIIKTYFILRNMKKKRSNNTKTFSLIRKFLF